MMESRMSTSSINSSSVLQEDQPPAVRLPMETENSNDELDNADQPAAEESDDIPLIPTTTGRTAALPSMTQTHPSYRADVQGLRGVLVVAVTLFHMNVPPFVSGYLAVDVFYVISGYGATFVFVHGMRPH
jgi:hypothetical protein